MTNDTQKQRLERRRKKVRLVIIALSVGAGLLCGFLPEQYQAACKFAARIAAFVSGGG